MTQPISRRDSLKLMLNMAGDIRRRRGARARNVFAASQAVLGHSLRQSADAGPGERAFANAFGGTSRPTSLRSAPARRSSRRSRQQHGYLQRRSSPMVVGFAQGIRCRWSMSIIHHR